MPTRRARFVFARFVTWRTLAATAVGTATAVAVESLAAGCASRTRAPCAIDGMAAATASFGAMRPAACGSVLVVLTAAGWRR